MKHAFDLGGNASNPKMVFTAIVVLQKILRDDRFHTKVKDEVDEAENQWMSSQVINAIQGADTLNEEQKQEVLKVTLALSCHAGWRLNGHLVIQILTFCIGLYSAGGNGTKAAAQAACTQTITEYLKAFGKSETADGFNDVIPVYQFITSRLDDVSKSKECPLQVAVLLQCLFVLFKGTKKEENQHFKRFVCTKMSPMLICYLDIGDRGAEKKAEKASFWKSNEVELKLSDAHMKLLASSIVELARILGSQSDMRPVIESLFHRLLICSKSKTRLIAMQILTEAFSDPESVTNLIAVNSNNAEETGFDSMPLFKLISDSIEECSHMQDQPKLISASSKCILTILKALEKIAEGDVVSAELAENVTDSYKCLAEADYNGPATYDGTARLDSTNRVDSSVDGNQSDDKNEESGNEDEGEKDLEEEKNSCGGSEVTEGPEEGFDDDQSALNLDTYVEEADNMEREAAIFHNAKIPKSLITETEVIPLPPSEYPPVFDEEQTHQQQHSGDETEDAPAEFDPDEKRDETERENAKLFLQKLKQNLPQIASARGAVEIDFRVQKFASNFCDEFSTQAPGNSESSPRIIILNADGVYLSTYYALQLNMRLAMDNFYAGSSCGKVSPSSRDEFLSSVLGSGLLVYVSPVWLSEVYDAISDFDVFGFSLGESKYNGLKHLLSDMEGFGRKHKGSQLMYDFKRFSQPDKTNDDDDENGRNGHLLKKDAGKRISRRILTTVWSSFLSHLMTSLKPFLLHQELKRSEGNGNGKGLAGRIFHKSNVKSNSERISLGLECLATSVSLCSSLELHDHCGEMLEPLTSLVCQQSNKNFDSKRLFSLESVIKNGIELASQAPDCWKYVMRCVTFVLQMDISADSPSTTSSATKASKSGAKKQKKSNSSSKDIKIGEDDLDLNFDSGLDDVGSGQNQSTFAPHPGFAAEKEEESLKEKFGLERELTSYEISHVNSILLKSVERLFDDAATKLNLQALLNFMSELGFCSHRELLTIYPKRKPLKKLMRPSPAVSLSVNATLLFHRISEVMLKCIKSGRPLLHIVKAWAIVGPHLTEASCHKEDVISKKAVAYIHDIITSFLQNTSEQPYFHFNETLFKPFENLICLELCDTDVQDQIVSSVCEFVETWTLDIGSGWRSLFGTLKAVRFPLPEFGFDNEESEVGLAREFHWRAVLDVFEAFLATEDPQVFANAALDYVSCLIHHVKGSEERQQLEELVDLKDVDRLKLDDSNDLTRASLQFLVRCDSILRKMHAMSNCPVFQGAQRVKILTTMAVVDPVIPDFELKSFDASTDTATPFPYSYKSLQTSDEVSQAKFLLKDRSKGLLRVWYLLIDGLTSAVMNCPREYQSQAVDTLFEIFSNLQTGDPDLVSFGLYCTNHLLLPMLQSWLRRSQRTFQGWLSSGPNFKHCMGRTAEFVMTWIVLTTNSNDKAKEKGSDLALKQLLLILIECTVVPVESIARLGCSCFRHIIMDGGPRFSSNRWNLVCLSLCRASQLALYPVHQLMAPFQQGTSNFYGDVGDVKVAARRDSCKRESHRLLQLAQQVLLLDEQRSEIPAIPDNPDIEERSFLFLLQPPGSNNEQQINTLTPLNADGLLRVPLRNLLTGLTSHHILLQLLGCILLKGTEHVIPSLANLLLSGSLMPPLTPCCDPETSKLPGQHKDHTATNLPGMLNLLSADQAHMLLYTLSSSYQTALQFDSRPGLKFLVQKVAQLNRAANLYKQAGASWSLIALTLFDLCMARIKHSAVTCEDIKKSLETQEKERNTFSLVKEAKVTKDEEKEADLLSSNSCFVDLHNLFLEICDLYVDIVVDKDGRHSKLDNMSKQQLYFLTIEPDDFYEMCKRPSPPHSAREKERSDSNISVKSNSNKSQRSSSISTASPKEKKPFQFSDFASQPIRPESPNVSEVSDVGPALSTSGGEPDGDEGSLKYNSEVTGEEVFRVATQNEMDEMMSEYRSHKGKRTMPSSSSVTSTPPASASASVAASRKNPFLTQKPNSSLKANNERKSNVDPDIANQQQQSLMADSEAKVAVWNELVLVYFRMSDTLSDEQFRLFLPLLFPGVKSLTEYAKEDELKRKIASFFQRVATIYGFDSEANN